MTVDSSGVFLENMDTVVLLKDLQTRIKVHWVAGNHDYHLMKLKNRAPHYHYPFEFLETLELKDGITPTVHPRLRVRVRERDEVHQADPGVLCHVMSDSDGVAKEDMWA